VGVAVVGLIDSQGDLPSSSFGRVKRTPLLVGREGYWDRTCREI
jgi:hypothetical protein